jgi:hypothetical protein
MQNTNTPPDFASLMFSSTSPAEALHQPIFLTSSHFWGEVPIYKQILYENQQYRHTHKLDENQQYCPTRKLKQLYHNIS